MAFSLNVLQERDKIDREKAAALNGKKVLIFSDIENRTELHKKLLEEFGATVEFEYLPTRSSGRYPKIPETAQAKCADAVLIYRPLIIDALGKVDPHATAVSATERMVATVDQTLREKGIATAAFDVCESSKIPNIRRHRDGDTECAIGKALRKVGGVGLGCFTTPAQAVNALAFQLWNKQQGRPMRAPPEPRSTGGMGTPG